MGFLDSLFGSGTPEPLFPKSSGTLDRYLQHALRYGLPEYKGERVAGLSPEQEQLLGQFFQAVFPAGLEGLLNLSSGDALGKAEGLLEPARARAEKSTVRAVRERQNIGNNLFSTQGAFQEGEAVSNLNAGFLQSLAQILPALQQIQLGAIGAVPGYESQSLSLLDVPRQLEQQKLDTAYNEFLRTTPGGGPLQALLGLFGGQGGAMQQIGTSPLQGLTQAAAVVLPILQAAGVFGGAAAASHTKFKHNIKEANDEASLEKIKKLKVNEWSYKGEKTRHMGPMAEDFAKAFNLGDGDEKIAYIDAIGTVMSATKALAKRLDELTKPNKLSPVPV